MLRILTPLLVHTSSEDPQLFKLQSLFQFLSSVSMVTWLECSSARDNHFTGRQHRHLEDRQVQYRGGLGGGAVQQQPGSFKVPHRILMAFHSDLWPAQVRIGHVRQTQGRRCLYTSGSLTICVHEGEEHACMMSAKVFFVCVKSAFAILCAFDPMTSLCPQQPQ